MVLVNLKIFGLFAFKKIVAYVLFAGFVQRLDVCCSSLLLRGLL
jgi:hypothetical protein